MRRALTALVSLSALAAIPSPTGRAEAVDRIELGAVNLVRAQMASVAGVEIPTRATVRNPYSQPGDLEVKGKGGFVGFVLAEDSADPNRDVYVGGRLTTSSGPQLFLFELGDLLASPRDTTINIHAGNYLLYVLPGSGSTSITLKLDGLDGSAVVVPRQPVRYEVSFPQPVRSGNLYGAGADGRLFGAGLLLGLLWLHTEAHAATIVDFCESKGPTPDDWMYLPGPDECDGSSGPGGSEGWIDFRRTTSPDLRLYYGSWEARASRQARRPAVYQQTVTAETASAIDDVGSMFVWLSYDY